MIVREVTYRVLCDGAMIGTWTRDDPAFWDADHCRFHKNEGSWCAHGFVYQGQADFDRSEWERGDDEDCLCDVLEFEVERMGDEVRRAT
jgi:hypothetical protein